MSTRVPLRYECKATPPATTAACQPHPLAADDRPGRRARLPLSRTLRKPVQASLDVRRLSALLLVPRSGCWGGFGRSAGEPTLPSLRQQVGSRAASLLLPELRNQLRCAGAAPLALHFGHPNALADSAALNGCGLPALVFPAEHPGADAPDARSQHSQAERCAYSKPEPAHARLNPGGRQVP